MKKIPFISGIPVGGSSMSRVFVLVTVFMFSVLSAAQKERVLHALLICDTLAPTISYAYQADLDRMKRNLEAIAVGTGLQLKLKMLTDKQVGVGQVKTWITKLPNSSKDVVLVYYVGREGTQRTKGPWPAIKTAIKKGALSADLVAKRVEKRHPRLTLVFFDCYEHLQRITKRHYYVNNTSVPSRGDCRTIKPLFTKAKGTFIACSGPKGRKGIGLIQDKIAGGVFTISLIDSIVNNKIDPKWSRGCITLEDNFQYILGTKRKLLIKRHVVDPHYELQPKAH